MQSMQTNMDQGRPEFHRPRGSGVAIESELYCLDYTTDIGLSNMKVEF